MIKIKPRLVIADPSLADARGHHFSLTQQITRGAQLQDIEVIWFTYKDFVAPNFIKNVSIYPVFSTTMYDRYRPEIKDNLPPDLDRILLNELNDGILSAGIGAEDHIYFHTGYGDLFQAVFQYGSSANWKSKPFLHICTPYDLDTMPKKASNTNALLEIFKNLRTLEAVDKKLFLWTETPQLATHFTLAYGVNFRGLPLPPPHEMNVDSSLQNNEAVTALYLGAAREEKGFLLLPQIAERLYETYGRTGKLKFVIQCTPQIIGYQPNIKEAIDKLARYPSSYVKLVDKVLDEQEYHNFLLDADIVLLLYDKKNYRIRGSGIAVETVCANRCILTHRDTFCASLITHGGGEAVEDVDEAIVKLAGMVERKGQYRQMAKIQGEQYRATNNVRNYVSRLLTKAIPNQAVPFLPSSIVGHVSPILLRIH